MPDFSAKISKMHQIHFRLGSTQTPLSELRALSRLLSDREGLDRATLNANSCWPRVPTVSTTIGADPTSIIDVSCKQLKCYTHTYVRTEPYPVSPTGGGGIMTTNVTYLWSAVDYKARFPLPELTARVNGSS